MKMKRTRTSFLLAMCVVSVLSGCATRIRFTSEPPGAAVLAEGWRWSWNTNRNWVIKGTTPCELSLRPPFASTNYLITSPSGEHRLITLEEKHGRVASVGGVLILGGMACAAPSAIADKEVIDLDACFGSMLIGLGMIIMDTSYSPTNIHVEFTGNSGITTTEEPNQSSEATSRSRAAPQ